MDQFERSENMGMFYVFSCDCLASRSSEMGIINCFVSNALLENVSESAKHDLYVHPRRFRGYSLRGIVNKPFRIV